MNNIFLLSFLILTLTGVSSRALEITDLPKELISKIFSYLPKEELVNVELVSKLFLQSGDKAWAQVYKEYFGKYTGEDGTTKDKLDTWKNFLKQQLAYMQAKNWTKLFFTNSLGPRLADRYLVGLNMIGREGAKLSGTDLTLADMKRRDWKGADFSNATLRKADLSWANLTNTNLHNADLTDADLRCAFTQDNDGDHLVTIDLLRLAGATWDEEKPPKVGWAGTKIRQN